MGRGALGRGSLWQLLGCRALETLIVLGFELAFHPKLETQNSKLTPSVFQAFLAISKRKTPFLKKTLRKTRP
jgi:hypothetical protein